MAKKLCEFPEALERENYLEAVSREFFINYEDLKRLVNRMGARLGPVAPREEEENTAGKKKKDREDGRNQSQRLLLTWLIENPFLFDRESSLPMILLKICTIR